MAVEYNDQDDQTLQQYFSSITTPICELAIDNIKHLVNSRCANFGILPPNKIYGYDNGCPICSSDYANDNWIVLHPCGHLLCSTCLEQINKIVITEGTCRKCPVCRTKSKWISSHVDNLGSSVTPAVSGFNYGNSHMAGSIAPMAPPPLRHMNRHHPYAPAHRVNRNSTMSQTYSSSAATPMIMNNGNNRMYSDCKLLKSKQPIMLNNSNNSNSSNQENNIICEISTQILPLDGENKLIGNLSVIANDLESGIQLEDNGIDLVIVFDVSGSMGSVAQQGIEILKYITDSLDSKDRLSIIVFDSVSRQLFPLQPMETIIKAQSKEIINSCFTGGSTNLASALKLLDLVIKDGKLPNRPFTVIMLSDGQPDYGSEGYDLVAKLYDSEIKPTIYSCTFGQNVSADVMKKILTEQNGQNYRHIEDMSVFKELVSEIGFDKNKVIGTNLKIRLKNIKALTSTSTPTHEINVIEIPIEQIKTNDMFTVPIVYMESIENCEISISYTGLDGINKIVQQIQIESPGNFIINNYWYKTIIQMVRELNTIPTILAKTTKLDQIKLLATVEKLGDFLPEINLLIEQTNLMIDNFNSNSNTYYNNSTQIVSRGLSNAATPMAAQIYRTSSISASASYNASQ